jgi:small-conductance mechanosensitive channel
MTRKALIALLLFSLAGLAWLVWWWLDTSASLKFGYSVSAIAVLYLLFSLVIEEFGARHITSNKTRYGFRKAMSVFLWLAALIVLLRIWIPNPQALVVAYGVVAAGLAVALQDVVKNIAGAVVIFVSGLFQVGNRVELDGSYGDVIDINLFHTTLLEIGGWINADQASGRILTVPNGVVLNRSVHNFTKHHKYLWDELTVVVTAESDWGEAMRLMGEIGHEHTKDFVDAADQSLTQLERYYYVEGHILDPNVYIKPDANGYALTLRYVVNAWQRRSTSSAIWGHIIRVFEEHPAIAIAPTSVAHVDYPETEHRIGDHEVSQ